MTMRSITGWVFAWAFAMLVCTQGMFQYTPRGWWWVVAGAGQFLAFGAAFVSGYLSGSIILVAYNPGVER